MREKPAALPKFQLNIIDRIVAMVNPVAGVKRVHARAALALSGAYSGASKSRPTLAGWTVKSGDADADLLWDIDTLRARSRDLLRNSPIAAGAIHTTVANVVGTGLSLQSRIDGRALGLSDAAASAWQETTEREWRLWAESTGADLGRRQNIYGLQDLALRSMLESGDVIAVLTRAERPDSPYQLAVQLIEADRLSNSNHASDTPQLTAGVEMDRHGAPLAYHISRTHPGALGVTVRQWDRILAYGDHTGRRNVLHLYRITRPGQVRGVPMLAPVIEHIKQLARYTEAEIAAAVVSGAFSVFVKMDPEAFSQIFDGEAQQTYLQERPSRWDGQLKPGAAVNLLPGEEIDSANPGRPNTAFDPFVQAVLRQVGVALEIPFEVLIKHFTSSYSASRAALLDFWRFVRCRRDWMATHFCQPIYEAFLAEAIALGRIQAPGWFTDPAVRRAYAAAQWIGDGPGAIDPAKEVAAAEKRVELGISTLAAESVLHDGGDWEDKHRQRIKETAARRELEPPAPPNQPERQA